MNRIGKDNKIHTQKNVQNVNTRNIEVPNGMYENFKTN